MSEDDRITDTTGRVVYTGREPHPFRTSTRFVKVNGEWQPVEDRQSARSAKRERTQEERERDRSDAKARRKLEDRAMTKIRKSIDKRQAVGDPSCVQSRSEDFPLMEALRREDNQEAIALVLRYRRIVAVCEAEPLKGLDYSKADGGEVVRISRRLTPEADIDAAAASNWKSVPDGEIKQSAKIKKSKGAYAIPSKRTVVADNDNVAAGILTTIPLSP